jgi:hypothetical protein
MSTTKPDLVLFAEAPGRFMHPAPGRCLKQTPRFSLAAERGHTYCAVEEVRLRADEIEDAIAEVDAFLHESGTKRASWWLSERSTPDDVEELLLAAGCTRDQGDYLHAAMLLTREPPAVDGVEARQIATFDEFVEARQLALGAFDNPHIPVPTREALAEQWELLADPLFAAWVDGRMASAGGAIFTEVGAYLMGGATAVWARGRGAYRAVVRARWDAAVERGTPALAVGAGDMSRPILERLGFEQVLQFRRVESVRSGA